MKTAEAEYILDKHCPVFSALFLDRSDKNIVDMRNRIIEAMKAYAKEACKEQREICATTREEAEHVNKGWRGVTVDILNAPEPELR